MTPRSLAAAKLQDYPPSTGEALITFAYKDPVRAATTAALAANTYSATAQTLTANSVGALAAVDGVSLAVGDVVLVKNEATGSHNGLYSVTSLGGASEKYVLTRTADASSSAQVVSGLTVYVSEGTVNGSKSLVLTTVNPITLDTTSLTFAELNALGAVTVSGSPSAAGQVLQSTSTTTAVWAPMAYYPVRGVVTAAVASLASFTVAGNDGITYAAGDVVLLVDQATASQNGPYVVGTVTTGTAPLARPSWWATGETAVPATMFVASEGTQGANSRWILRTAGPITIDTTSIAIDMLGGNWVQMTDVATIGTQTAPSSVFVAGVTLKARLSGVFRVSCHVALSSDTTADAVTVALISDTAADGAGAVLASANKVAHGVAGFGAYGTRGSDGETVDTNAGASLTFNGAAWSTAPITQKTQTFPTLTGLLTANGSGALSFSFSGVCHDAVGTTKTPFTVGNQVAFGLKISASHVITVANLTMSVEELPNQ